MFVTRHSNVIDTILADQLWALYDLAYRGMAEAVVTREMLFRSEFDAALADSTNRVWVLWDDELPIAMTLVATDIGATRYLSRAYFERRFPEHAEHQTVHYVMWLVVHPQHQARGAAMRLARESASLEASDGALLVFDAPDVNQPTAQGAFVEMARRVLRVVDPSSTIHDLGTSRYFAIDFAAAATAAPSVVGDLPVRAAG